MSPLPSFAVTMGPVSWTYNAELVCTKHFDALKFEGLTLHLLSLRGKVTCYSESSRPPNIRGHQRFLCARHPIGHLTLLSRLLFHRVSTPSPGKLTLSSDLLTLSSSSLFHVPRNSRLVIGRTRNSQGHTFTAWKIGKNVGIKALKEAVEKSKNLLLRFFLF